MVTDCSARLELAVLQHDKQKSTVTLGGGEEQGGGEWSVDRCGECVGEGRYLLARVTAHKSGRLDLYQCPLCLRLAALTVIIDLQAMTHPLFNGRSAMDLSSVYSNK